MGSHFRRGGARHISMAAICSEAAEERDHPLGDLIGPLGDDIAPAAGRRVPGEHGALGRGQPWRGARSRFGRRPVLPGDHQDAIVDTREGRGIETARHAQHNASQPLWVLCRHARNIAWDGRAEMRDTEAEMIHQHGQPLGRRQIGFLCHAPLPASPG